MGNEPMVGTQLIHFDKAREALALASSIDEVKQIRDQAEAIRQYIRQQKGSLEIQNQAAEIKIRAERRAGEMLGEIEKNPGGRPSENLSHDVISYFPLPTLPELGITAMQSHRWQLEAKVPEEIFQKHVDEIKTNKQEVTSSALQKMGSQIAGKAKQQAERMAPKIKRLQEIEEQGIYIGTV